MSGASILLLEKRIAFDGAAVATASRMVSHARETVRDQTTDHFAFQPARATEAQTALAPIDLGVSLKDVSDARANDTRPAQSVRSVVFIESDVPDVKDLIRNIDASARIVMLDARQDGVDAIATYLQAHPGFQNVYVFSHGSDGHLNLGTAVLDSDSMQGRYASDLATIKGALGTNANILVYGCDFAQRADGDSAARLLSSLTGASVAASTNLTGGTAQGGDFVLEDHIGTITAPNILSLGIADDYQGLLATQKSGAFTVSSGTDGVATSSQTIATATTADGAVKIVVTVSPNANNSTGSITTKASGATFDTTAPVSAYTTSLNGASALEETLEFGGATGGTDGANSATITIAYFDATTGAAITVLNPIINIDRLGGSFTNTGSQSVSISSDLTITTAGATLTKLSGSSNAFNVTASDIYETPNVVLASNYSTDANADPTLGTAAGTVLVNGSYSTLTFNWSKASGSLNGGDRIDLVFSADTGLSQNGTLAGKTVTDGQAGVSVATAQAFSNPSGLSTVYSATGLPAGLAIDTATGVISGTVDHDASNNAPSKTGSGATLDGTYTVTVTARNSAGNSAIQQFSIDSTNQAPLLGTTTANQTNNDGDTITPVDASRAFNDPNGDSLTYTASGLPSGLVISSAGLITGTVSKTATPGTDMVVVTAKDDKGATTNESFKWEIKDIPPTAVADTFAAPHDIPATINVFGNDSDALGRQLTITQVNGTSIAAGASGLAVTGGIVTLNSNGTLTFAPNAGYTGSPSFTYTIADPVGGTAVAMVSGTITDARPIVDLNGPQTVVNTIVNGSALGSSGWSETNGAQKSGGYYFNDDYATGSLSQAGVTGLDHGAGAFGAAQLSFGFAWNNGTPDASAATVNVTVGGVVYARIVTGSPGQDPNVATVTYLNGASGNLSSVLPTAYMNWSPIQLTIDLPANVAASGTVAFNVDSSTSTDDVYFTNVKTSTLPVTSYDNAVTYAEKGTPVAIAASSASVFDGDSANMVSASVILANKLAGDQLSIGGTVVTNGSAGTINGLSYAVTDNNGAETIAISGSATKAIYQRTIAAIAYSNADYAPATTQRIANVTTNDGITASNTAITTIAVVDLGPAATGTLRNQVIADGHGIAIGTSGGFADPSGSPLTYSATGLPAGLAIDPASGVISGTIDHDASANAPTKTGSGATLDGTYGIIVTATDTVGRTAMQRVTIDTTNQAPVLANQTVDQTNADGDRIVTLDASKAFSDPNGDPLTFTASNLPAGLSIDSGGMIGGTVTPDARPGVYRVTVTATDDKGAATTESFNWTIVHVAPTVAAALPALTYADSTANIAITTASGFSSPNGARLTFRASGLPTGLTIDTSSGLITGQLGHDASANAPVKTGSGATLDGRYTVVVTASDGQGGTATQTFTIHATNNAPVIGTPTPTQNSADGGRVSVDASAAFGDPNIGDVITFSASGLPAGLSINPTTGLISGILAKDASTHGPYATIVTATDDKGAATAERFVWRVADVVPIASPPLADRAVYDGAMVNYATAIGFTNPNALPLTYSATGLPAGLTIDPTTGLISGTLDRNASTIAGRIYAVAVSVDDGQGGVATNTFHLTASNQAPVLATPTANQTGIAGQSVTPVSLGFSDPNGDGLTFTVANLPRGLSIDALGTIGGTIAGNATPGVYSVVAIATDTKNAATQEIFTWTVADAFPTVAATIVARTVVDSQPGLSIDTASGFVSPNGLPLTYRATGLPAGLAINATTGLISGQIDHDASKNAPATAGAGATLDGTYTVIVIVDDGQGGTALQRFTIDATNQAPIVATTALDQHSTAGNLAQVNTAIAFTDPNNGDTLTYSARGLPAGLSIDPATGLVTGTIEASAGSATPYSVSITATDDKLAASTKTISWVVDVPLGATTPIPDISLYDGTTPSPIDTASHFSNQNNAILSYTATNLPVGLTIDPTTGLISGQIEHNASYDAATKTGAGATLDGRYAVVVTATDGTLSSTQAFVIDVANQAPAVTRETPDQATASGTPITTVDTSLAFHDPNGDTLTYAASGLPTGLAIDTATGAITGTTAKTAAGVYAVTITATDNKGAMISELFQLTVSDTIPVVIASLPRQGFADSAGGISIDTRNAFASPTGLTLTYTANGLPVGLSIDPISGLITGSLSHDASLNAPTHTGAGATLQGSYTVTVTASDGHGGSVSQTIVIDAVNEAPAVVSMTNDQHGADGAIVSLDAAPAFRDPNIGDILTYRASGLPAGLAIDPASGLIHGTIDKSASRNGPYSVVVTATDDKGAAVSEAFLWRVNIVAPIATPHLADEYAYDGAMVAIPTVNGFVNPNNQVLTFSATGLPAGLVIDSTSGIISGTLGRDASAMAANGVYTIAVTADDGQGGRAVNTFYLTATNQAPRVVAATADQISSDGQVIAPLDAGRAFVDPNGDTLTYSAGNLPAGLIINRATGRITGTVSGDATPGPYNVTLTATDSKGAATSETFVWRIETVTPNVFVQPSVLARPTLLDPVPEAARTATPFADIHVRGAVLDAVSQISGDQEQSIVIHADEIVVSTVNNLHPLVGLQDLGGPGGIVRAGAATNEAGDRYRRADAGLPVALSAQTAPDDYLGSSLRDSGFLTGNAGTTINVETLIHDRVLTIVLDNSATNACVVPVARYDVTGMDGSPLPAWLRSSAKGVLSGKIPSGIETMNLKIRATLANGIVSEREVRIGTVGGTIRPANPAERPEGRLLSDMIVARATPSTVGLAHLLPR